MASKREINESRVEFTGDVDVAEDLSFGGLLVGEGFKYIKLTGIVATKQVIIANATGDVTQVVFYLFTLSDGTTGVANAVQLAPGGTDAIAVGGSTWTVTCAANGELSVIRTAGAGTATMTFLITWI